MAYLSTIRALQQSHCEVTEPDVMEKLKALQSASDKRQKIQAYVNIQRTSIKPFVYRKDSGEHKEGDVGANIRAELTLMRSIKVDGEPVLEVPAPAQSASESNAQARKTMIPELDFGHPLWPVQQSVTLIFDEEHAALNSKKMQRLHELGYQSNPANPTTWCAISEAAKQRLTDRQMELAMEQHQASNG